MSPGSHSAWHAVPCRNEQYHDQYPHHLSAAPPLAAGGMLATPVTAHCVLVGVADAARGVADAAPAQMWRMRLATCLGMCFEMCSVLCMVCLGAQGDPQGGRWCC